MPFIGEARQWPEDYGQPAINGECLDGLTAITKKSTSQWTEDQVYCVSVARGGEATTWEVISYRTNKFMRDNDVLLFACVVIFALLLALNLLYVFRSVLGRIARYLAIMALAGSGAFSAFSSFGYRWRMEEPLLMGLRVMLVLGAWFAYREFFITGEGTAYQRSALSDAVLKDRK
jgi:hypothetical protein